VKAPAELSFGAYRQAYASGVASSAAVPLRRRHGHGHPLDVRRPGPAHRGLWGRSGFHLWREDPASPLVAAGGSGKEAV